MKERKDMNPEEQAIADRLPAKGKSIWGEVVFLVSYGTRPIEAIDMAFAKYFEVCLIDAGLIERLPIKSDPSSEGGFTDS